ncbi:uncharacterized protein A1O9_10315 [Exophiala aquamarina CBS 119918]|uniref:RING-type domain-containing protein n=1 Tax=Exophiala aquamarina CBS 119918 TaxID=1182545 RepID=A0A072PCR5_9EURO|nr:uncharacterized protein A1O9_10315 [Exophiala aquamarina CBS 119918]KEF53340.1 hypothetical protein A1O9_10315 [Exophiala aquamarina CBS 119918]
MSSTSVSLGDSFSLSPGSDFEQTPPRIQHHHQHHRRRDWSPPPTAPADPAGPSNSSRPAHPPRLPSPRLFRDFFSAMSDTASRRQATLPPANYSESIQDVNRALQSANRALQNAQEAFQIRRSRPDRQSLVDLTSSSPPSDPAEVNFLSETTHPQDPRPHRTGQLNSLNEPVHTFGALDLPPINLGNTATLLRLWPVRLQDSESAIPIPSDVRRLQEEEAIHRQRENHNNWQRTQARTRERERIQANQTQSMSPSASSSSSQPASRPRSAIQRAEDPAIESVDLTEVDDNVGLSSALAKQRQDAILAQNPGTESGRTKLTAYKCPVCMDTPTDATSTVCGHVFCHRCIIDTLNWSIDQRREDMPTNRKVKGVCPVCRKQLELKDTGTGRHLIPLELKLMMVSKRKRDQDKEATKGKGKQKLVKAGTLSENDEDDAPERKRNKESTWARKASTRESTEDALWGEFIQEP